MCRCEPGNRDANRSGAEQGAAERDGRGRGDRQEKLSTSLEAGGMKQRAESWQTLGDCLELFKRV